MNIQNYRNDINGLRFLAVLLIFLTHISIPGFDNGFIGVDIFFVISGFLITSLLNKQQNKKEIKDFIIKRIKRLFPNLFLISLLIFFLSLFFLPSYLNKNLYLNFYSGIFGFANFNFIFQANNYFDTSGEINPFLHLWSLSVEIHFYIIFLLIFFVLRSYSKKNFFYFVLIISIFSLFLSEDLSTIHQFYYLTLTRIFEFGIGSLVFLINPKLKTPTQNKISIAAFAMFIASISLIEKTKGVPSLQLLFPCIATSVIIATPNSHFNRFISNNLFNYLGKLSYLIYLTHWPIIVFASFYFKLTAELKIILFIITLLLSSFMYHFYETKLRFINLYFNFFLIFSFISILVVSCLGLNNYHGYKNNQNQENIVEEKLLRLELEGLKNKLNKNIFNDIIFIGDSFADDLFLSQDQNSFLSKPRIGAKIHVDTVCYNSNHKRPILGVIINQTGTCEAQIKNLENELKKNKPRLVILSNHWKEHNFKYSLDAIKIIKNIIDSNIIVIGMRDTFRSYHQIFSRNKENKQINFDFYQNKNDMKSINIFLKQISNNKNIIYYQLPSICNSKQQSCRVISELTSKINYLDHSHYSLDYSKTAMNEINLFLKHLGYE